MTAPTLHFPLWGDPEGGRVATAEFAGSRAVSPVFGDGRPAVWRWSRPRIDERPGDLVCRTIRGREGERVDIFQLDWLHREGGRRKKLRTIWLSEEIGSTDTAVAELKRLIGHVFESPKPTGLVRRILATMPSDIVVLDPFAGSGTTGHAVALANVADGGSRRCLSINSARAHPRGVERPAGRACDGRRHHPRPPGRRGGAGRRRARAQLTPTAFSRALSSLSRCISSRWRWGTVRRQPVRPKHIFPS